MRAELSDPAKSVQAANAQFVSGKLTDRAHVQQIGPDAQGVLTPAGTSPIEAISIQTTGADEGLVIGGRVICRDEQ